MKKILTFMLMLFALVTIISCDDTDEETLAGVEGVENRLWMIDYDNRETPMDRTGESTRYYYRYADNMMKTYRTRASGSKEYITPYDVGYTLDEENKKITINYTPPQTFDYVFNDDKTVLTINDGGTKFLAMTVNDTYDLSTFTNATARILLNMYDKISDL